MIFWRELLLTMRLLLKLFLLGCVLLDLILLPAHSINVVEQATLHVGLMLLGRHLFPRNHVQQEVEFLVFRYDFGDIISL